jgi:hypothetical protein
MNIFDPLISGSLSVSGSGHISGDLTVLGTINATISGTTSNAISASHAASYTLTSSFHQHTNSFNTFTSSYTTGSFTGSFVGDGGELYNIPASGVTGLNLSQISDGSVTASLSQANGFLINTNTEITGNLTVTGRLTAQEYHTELVSASIIYESGSTKFGDSLDDTHEITGSVDVSGSLEVNNLSIGGDRLVNISVSDAGGKYYIDNVKNPILTLIKGYTYKFLFPNIGSHPLKFSTTNDGTHNGGSIYTTGVTTGATPDYIQIEVTDSTPSTLYYFCTIHHDMGNSISVLSDILNLEADRNIVYIEPSRIATTGSNTFIGTEVVSGSLSVTGSVNITGSITLNGQAIGTGKLDEITFQSYTSSNDSRVSSIETSTGSLNSFTNSIDTTIKTKMNNDGVVSGSIQIDITGTTGFSTLSSSIATTDSNQEYRLNSIETSTGSLNTFSSSANGRLNSLETASGSIRTDFNSYTSSNDSTNSTQNNRLTAIETATSSLNTFTSSINTTIKSKLDDDGVISGSIQVNITGTTEYSTFSSSIATTTSGLSSSIDSISSSITATTSGLSSSIGSLSSSVATTTSGLSSSIGSLSSSVATTTSDLSSSIAITTSGLTSTITSLSSSVATTTSELSSSIGSLSSSVATTTLGTKNRVDSIESKTGSYATTGSNIFIGTQIVTGSLYVSQNLIVQGSSSLENITASAVSIGTNTIVLNTDSPAFRYAGISVFDSGSTNITASLFYDSLTNQWKFKHTDTGTNDASIMLFGPLGSDIDSAPLLDGNYLTKVENNGHGHHLTTSSIFDNGTKVSINSNTEVTGTLKVTGNISSPNITAIETSTGSLNTFTSSLLTAVELTGSNLTIRGNLLVKGTTTNVNTSTLDVDNNLINLNGTGATLAGLRVKDTTAPNQVSGSLLWDATNDYWIGGQLGSEQRLVRETEFNTQITRINNVETSTGSLNSFTSSINTTIKNKLNSDGVVSGSSQVSFNGITDKPTLVSGSSQISFNGISDKPTLVSGSSQITYGSISGIPSGIVSGSSQVLNGTTIHSGSFFNGITVVSGSAQITYSGISGIPSGIVSGSSQISFSGISGLPTLVSGSSQITYSGLSGIPSGIVSGSAQLTSTFVQKNGDTMTGQLVIGSTGTGNAATLKVNNSSASSFNHSIEAFSVNMTAGQTNILVVGASGTTKNSGYIGYNWSSAGSNSNYVSIGHWGADHLLRVYGDGTIYMGTVTTGTWQGSSISTTYTDAKVTSVTGTANQVIASSTTGAITLSLPQNIHTGATPTFAGLTVNGGATTATFRNTTASSNSNVCMGNDASANGTGIALLGSTFASSGQYRANGGYIYSNLAGGLTLHAEGANSMYLATNGTAAITINSSQVVTFANTITGSVSGNAGTVTNGVYTNGSYSNPDWITGLAGTKITGTVASATSADQIDGVSFVNSNINNALNANNIDSNVVGYVTNVDGSSTNLTGNASDGAIYGQAYSSNWQHQIYGDYRTGIMYVRGKNNNTWQSWKRVALSNSTTFSNVSSVSFTHNLGTANLTAQVFDSSNNMFFPSEINITSTTVTVTFATNRTGRLVVTG